MRIVAEDNSNRITNLRTDKWTENSKMFPLTGTELDRSESCVAIFSKNRFVIDPVLQRSTAALTFRGLEMLQPSEIPAPRRVIPIYFLRGNIVGANDAAGGGHLMKGFSVRSRCNLWRLSTAHANHNGEQEDHHAAKNQPPA